jgi:hypothetical protein
LAKKQAGQAARAGLSKAEASARARRAGAAGAPADRREGVEDGGLERRADRAVDDDEPPRRRRRLVEGDVDHQQGGEEEEALAAEAHQSQGGLHDRDQGAVVRLLEG